MLSQSTLVTLYRGTHLVGVLGDDGGVEREGPGAAVELLAGGGRGRGGLAVPRLRHVAVHQASEKKQNQFRPENMALIVASYAICNEFMSYDTSLLFGHNFQA